MATMRNFGFVSCNLEMYAFTVAASSFIHAFTFDPRSSAWLSRLQFHCQ